jgi:hypothetical protein
MGTNVRNSNFKACYPDKKLASAELFSNLLILHLFSPPFAYSEWYLCAAMIQSKPVAEKVWCPKFKEAPFMVSLN